MDVPYYRKKSAEDKILVRAVKLTEENVGEVANWSQSQMVIEKDAITDAEQDALNLRTPNGVKRVSLGEYVVKVGVSFVKAKPGEFEKLYVMVSRVEAGAPLTDRSVTSNPFEGMRRAKE